MSLVEKIEVKCLGYSGIIPITKIIEDLINLNTNYNGKAYLDLPPKEYDIYKEIDTKSVNEN
jgi:hypothetical protein